MLFVINWDDVIDISFIDLKNTLFGLQLIRLFKSSAERLHEIDFLGV